MDSLYKSNFKMIDKGKIFERIMVIGDVHAPFTSNDCLEALRKVRQGFKPDLIIQVGDLMDLKAWSKYGTEPDDLSPQDEFSFAMDVVDKLSRICPNMHLVMGNHDIRTFRRATFAQLPKQMLRELSEIFPYKGWKFNLSPNDRVIANTEKGPVLFLHGDEDGGDAIAKAGRLGVSVVQGHDHKSYFQFINSLTHTIFGASCGCIIDSKGKGFRYAARMNNASVQGVGLIYRGVYRFEPFI